MAGYHLYDIPKGVLGQYSKVIEEFQEFQDAIEQDATIMAIIELSDLIGSAKYYFYEKGQKNRWQDLMAHILSRPVDKILPVDANDLTEAFSFTVDEIHSSHWEYVSVFLTEIDNYVRGYNLTMRDLIRMSSITERAFLSGRRS